jgi:asparagine synthase (glutamine-hydrolysing)
VDQFRQIERIPTWIRRQLLKPLASAVLFTWPGWNSLYAMGRWQDGGLPCELGIFPWIQEQLYSRDLKDQVVQHDPLAFSRRILKHAGHLDAVSRYQYLDTLQYLPADILTKVDRMSMANSLEVRSPLLDYTVVEYLATLPLSFKLRGGTSKYLLRKLCERLLPASVLTKRKQGFAIPKDRWFQNDLRAFAEDLLLDRRTLARGYFRKNSLKRLLKHHASGQRDYSTWIWCLIVLEMWHRLCLEG